MGDPPRSRRSLLSQQAAKDGLSFNSSNADGLLQDLPKASLKLIAGSNRGRKVSARGATSLKTPSLVTPVSRGMVPRSGTASTGIPVPTNRALNVGGSGTGTGAGTRGRPAARPPTGITVRNAVGRFQMNTTRNTLPRTMSADNLVDTMSDYRTPRARSRSPGAAAKDLGTVSKLGPLPGVNDKQSLHSMIEKILAVFAALGNPQEVKPGGFKSLGGTVLQKMFSFLLQIMVGPNEGKDEVAYISNGLNMLGCPVTTLKQSQLKTLSVPHTLPHAITAMCWLACYVEDFMGLRPQGLDLPENENQDVENETWDTYKKLFFSQISGEELDLEEELDNYKSRIVEIFDDCPETSVAELRQELEEKMERKEKLFAQADPRAEVLNVMNGQNEILEKEGKRLAELETRLSKFTNLTALQSAEAHLESTLARLKRELASLMDAVNGQTISKADAERKVNEIADMKKQQDSLQVVLENLQKKLHNQEQFLRNDQKRFHEVCCGFSVIEQFNNAAKNWRDTVPHLEKNPFDVTAMQSWLRNVKQKLAAAKRILERRREHYLEEEKVCASVCETLDANLNALEDECNRIESELSFQGHEQQHKMDQVSEELQRVEQQLNEAVRVVGQLTSEIAARKKDLAELEQANEADAKLIEDLTAKATEIDTRVERLHGQNKLAEVEVQEYLLAFVVDARSKVNASLAKLNDPEFRRQVAAKRNGSKTGGGGCSSNAKGGSDKDSNEAA